MKDELNRGTTLGARPAASPRRKASPTNAGAVLRTPDDLPGLFVRQRRAAVVRRAILRVFIYTRYSTDRQEEKSEERQVVDARMHAGKINGVVARVFSDRGVSGTTMVHRPEFMKMLEAIRRGECDVLIVEDLDRLSRRLADLLAVHDELKERKVELHDVTNGKLDRVQVIMRGYIGEEGRIRFLALSKAGKQNAVRGGRMMQRPAYGFRALAGEKGVHEVDERTSAVVVNIFTWIALGMSAKAVARKLMEDGVPPPLQDALAGPDGVVPEPGAWHSTTIRNIIRNPIYIGWVVFGETTPRWDRVRHVQVGADATDESEWIVLQVPEFAFVDPDLWERANLEWSSRPHAGAGHFHGTFLLTGRIACGVCGGPMKATVHESASRYVCSRRMSRGAAGCAHAASPRLDLVEATVIRTTIAQFLTKAAIERYQIVLAQRIDELTRGDEARRAQIARRLDAIDVLLRRSFEADAMKGFKAQRIAKMRSDLEAEAEGLSEELAGLRHPADLSGGLRTVETLRGKMDRMLAEVPFRPESGDVAGIELRSAFRDLVRGVVLMPPDERGLTPIEIRINLLDRGKAGLAPNEFASTHVVLRASIDIKTLLAVERMDWLAARNAGLEAAAEDGRHDVSDEEWELVASLFPRSGKTKIDPREVFNGIICLCKEGGVARRMPERFGGTSFEDYSRHFIMSGRFDAAVAKLRERDAGCLRGVDLSRFARCRRSTRFEMPEAAVAERDRRALLRIAEACTPGGLPFLRARGVALVLGGSRVSEAARAVGMSHGFLDYWLQEYMSRGVDGVAAPTGKPKRLPSDQIEELRAMVANAVDPDDPDKPITLEALSAVCLVRYGVIYTPISLGAALRRSGIMIGRSVAARKRERRMREAGRAILAEAKPSPRGRGAFVRPGSRKHRRERRAVRDGTAG